MVKKIDIKGKEAFICENCKLAYLDSSIAQKCENWCNENNSCNIEMIKDAIKNE